MIYFNNFDLQNEPYLSYKKLWYQICLFYDKPQSRCFEHSH